MKGVIVRSSVTHHDVGGGVISLCQQGAAPVEEWRWRREQIAPVEVAIKNAVPLFALGYGQHNMVSHIDVGVFLTYPTRGAHLRHAP
jgi:hypothetical protein